MRVSRSLAAAAAAACLTVGVALAATPASAASATQRRDVCFTGACGSATVTFKDHWNATVSMSVADTDCDNHAAEIRIIAYQWSYSNQEEYTWTGPWHVNNGGCNTGWVPWNNLPFAGGDPLLGFKVEACVKDTDRCETSTEMANPH